jgi:hypothetical protein
MPWRRIGEVEVQLHAFFNLGSRWMWLVSFTPRPLYPQGKSPWYPLDRRPGGPQSRSGRGGEEKNSQPQPGIEARIPIVQPVAHLKVSGVAAWSENCKWYNSVPVSAVYRCFVNQYSEFCRRNPLCCFSMSVYCCCCCCCCCCYCCLFR